LSKVLGKVLALALLVLLRLPPAFGADYLPLAKDFLGHLIDFYQKPRDPKDISPSLKEVSSRVDFEALARKSMGKRWAGFAVADRKAFLDTLRELLEIIVYPQAKKIALKASDIQYDTVQGDTSPQVRAVGTVDRESNGEMISQKVEVIFVFDPSSQKIVDAIVEGEKVSTNLQRQFNEALKKETFRQIVDQMKRRLDEARKNQS
jgi:ABC-type transporter MlaC component